MRSAEAVPGLGPPLPLPVVGGPGAEGPSGRFSIPFAMEAKEAEVRLEVTLFVVVVELGVGVTVVCMDGEPEWQR